MQPAKLLKLVWHEIKQILPKNVSWIPSNYQIITVQLAIVTGRTFYKIWNIAW